MLQRIKSDIKMEQNINYGKMCQSCTLTDPPGSHQGTEIHVTDGSGCLFPLTQRLTFLWVLLLFWFGFGFHFSHRSPLPKQCKKAKPKGLEDGTSFSFREEGVLN